MIRRCVPQKRPVAPPISNIEIETPSSIDPLLDLFRKMGVPEDNDGKPFQELATGKGLEDRRGNGRNMKMRFLVTPVAQLPANPAGKTRACEMNNIIGHPVLENSSEDPFSPRFRG
jgi:hypothetical protein